MRDIDWSALGASILSNNTGRPGQTPFQVVGNAFGDYQQMLAYQKQQNFINQYKQAQLEQMQAQQAQKEREYEREQQQQDEINAWVAANPDYANTPSFLLPDVIKASVLPKEADPTSDIQNYQYYVEQTKATGKQPMSYQNWRLSGKQNTNFNVNPDGTINFSQGYGVPGNVAGNVPKVTDLQKFTDIDGNPPPHPMSYQQLMEGGYRLRSDADIAGEITPVEKQEKARQKVSDTLSELSGIYNQLSGNKAIRSSDMSVGENIMAYGKTSEIGQELQRAAGTENQKLRDMVRTLQPGVLLAIKDAADMGVKMMDTPAELEFYLRMATSPNEDVAVNMMALNVLEKAFGNNEAEYKIAKEAFNKRDTNVLNNDDDLFKKADAIIGVGQ